MDFTNEQLDREFTACYKDGSIASEDCRLPAHFTLREARDGVAYRTRSGNKGTFKLSASNLKKLARLEGNDLQCLYGHRRYWVGARLSEGSCEDKKSEIIEEIELLEKELVEIVKPISEALAQKIAELKALNKSTKGKVKK